VWEVELFGLCRSAGCRPIRWNGFQLGPRDCLRNLVFKCQRHDKKIAQGNALRTFSDSITYEEVNPKAPALKGRNRWRGMQSRRDSNLSHMRMMLSRILFESIAELVAFVVVTFAPVGARGRDRIGRPATLARCCGRSHHVDNTFLNFSR
jgi:hypothetical protein